MENKERLDIIRQENIIWIIVIILILVSLYGNSIEAKFFRNNDIEAREKYIKIQMGIFTVALIIYIFFFVDSYSSYSKLSACDSKKKIQLTEANLIATSLVLIAGIIFLGIVFFDDDLETEVSFT